MHPKVELKLVNQQRRERDSAASNPHLQEWVSSNRAKRPEPARDYWLTTWAIALASGTTLGLVLWGIAHRMGVL